MAGRWSSYIHNRRIPGDVGHSWRHWGSWWQSHPHQMPSCRPWMLLQQEFFYSLVLQAVCDHEMRITDVFVGWPGSAHDTTVFDDSDLGRLSATNPSTLFRDGTHLLGDKAYCLTPTLLIPYKEGRDLENSSERLRFNKAHSSTRIVIERAFGCMKGRFRRLMYTIDLCFIVKLIQSVCVLHNIALPHDTGSFIEELCHEASVLGGGGGCSQPAWQHWSSWVRVRFWQGEAWCYRLQTRTQIVSTPRINLIINDPWAHLVISFLELFVRTIN